eukprot:gene43712-58245_t
MDRPSSDEDELEDLLRFLDPNMVIIGYQVSKRATINAVNLIQTQLYKLSEHPQCGVGIRGMPLGEIQDIIEHVEKPINLVCLPTCQPPDLHLRTVEFVHSRKVNTMIDVSTDSLVSLDYLKPMSETYGKSCLLVLTKALLQYGALVCFNAEFDGIKDILHLGHPFTHRGEHMAPS